MRLRYVLKLLAHSRSLRFAIQTARKEPSATLQKLRWRGREVFYRAGTTDPKVLYQNLLRGGTKAEYYVPASLKPKLILDIGSNIGASILYFHELFPQAQIIGFEPHPATFEVLRRNVADIASVSVFNYGLGAADARIALPFDGVSFGGFGVLPRQRFAESDLAPVECEIRHAGESLRQLGVREVDLLKIDCEGSELDVFRVLEAEMVARCKWIVGEMHDASAFEILARLAPHFDLDLRKQMFAPTFRFHACNLSLTAKLKDGFDPAPLQS